MTMAAELMAAGANQQLIAAKLAEAHDLKPGVRLRTRRAKWTVVSYRAMVLS